MPPGTAVVGSVNPAASPVSVAVGIATGGKVITIGAAGDGGREAIEPVRSTSPPLALSVINIAEAPLGGTGGDGKFSVKGVADAPVTALSADPEVGGANTEP